MRTLPLVSRFLVRARQGARAEVVGDPRPQASQALASSRLGALSLINRMKSMPPLERRESGGEKREG